MIAVPEAHNVILLLFLEKEAPRYFLGCMDRICRMLLVTTES